MNMQFYDYIIVGSGIAGLYTALLSQDLGRVLVITKSSLQDCNTAFAQGGIATRPPLGVFGERGTDALIPLRAGGLGTTINFNFSGNLVVDSEMRQRELARAVQQLITENARRGVAI